MGMGIGEEPDELMYVSQYWAGVYSTMASMAKGASAMGWRGGCRCIDAELGNRVYAPCCSSNDVQLDALEQDRWRSSVLQVEMERAIGEDMGAVGLGAMTPKFDI